MKIKNGCNLIKNNDNYIIEPINKTVSLGEVGLFLWDTLTIMDCSNAELLSLLLEKFDISTVLALGEIDSFIKLMKENGILE